MKRLKQITEKTIGNSLYPFFWQHGEDHQILGEYMEKICASGMRGVCIEARPHPEFVGDGWWKDVDFLIEKAKSLDMKLWILDDSHFPTGFANGKVKSSYPQYLKKYLDIRRYDVQGPFCGGRIDFKLLKGKPWDKPDPSEKILGVYMAKRANTEHARLTDQGYNDPVYADSIQDITHQMNCETRLLTVDIPSGAYSIFVVYVTRKGGEEMTKDYLNPLVKEATQILIDEVYEPHYQHYASEFGKTIQGFFSDEPRFGNHKGSEAKIGSDMVLPWRDGLEKELGFEEKYLPLLWINALGKEKEIRFQYMDKITRLYQQNFTAVLGNWCKDHGVLYIGHTIEDNGAHARLGYGTGHYFRGQQGMDMAGIDVIGGQIVPGMPYHHDAFNTGGSNGEFYHYALAKLASSAAHLDPSKKGRAMCEAFGAYGWNEGLKMMKWIADHLMVRGINYLVPHAFDPKEFPDFDCPPHFYAHGHNPQFRYFRIFTDYVNRICNLFRDGIYPAKVGVLYPAEMEWAGKYEPVEKISRKLTEIQVPFDIVTRDHLLHAKIEENSYVINQHPFEILIVPYGECIPADLTAVINNMQSRNIKVYFMNAIPETVLGGAKQMLRGWGHNIVSEKECMNVLKKHRSIQAEQEFPELVVGEYLQQNKKLYMFFNESIEKTVDTWLTVKEQPAFLYKYDAFTDKIFKIYPINKKYHLRLEPYESAVWIIDENLKDCDGILREETGCEIFLLSDEWHVTFADSLQYPDIWEEVPLKTAVCVEKLPGWEQKSGTLRYEKEIDLKDLNVNGNSEGEERILLSLGEAFETAEVFINDKSAGCRICPPYQFDLTDFLKQGTNRLSIEITNTLGTSVRDAISHYLMIEPFGIRGPVKILKKNFKKNGDQYGTV